MHHAVITDRTRELFLTLHARRAVCKPSSDTVPLQFTPAFWCYCYKSDCVLKVDYSAEFGNALNVHRANLMNSETFNE